MRGRGSDENQRKIQHYESEIEYTHFSVEQTRKRGYLKSSERSMEFNPVQLRAVVLSSGEFGAVQVIDFRGSLPKHSNSV